MADPRNLAPQIAPIEIIPAAALGKILPSSVATHRPGRHRADGRTYVRAIKRDFSESNRKRLGAGRPVDEAIFHGASCRDETAANTWCAEQAGTEYPVACRDSPLSVY